MSQLRDMVLVAVVGTPGTGTISLGPAVTGFQTFAQAGALDGEVSYSIKDGNAWEVGRGVYSSGAGTLTRGPLFSSNGGAAINASANTQVGITVLAEDFQFTIGGNTLAGATTGYLADIALVGMGGVSFSASSNSLTISGATGGAAGGTSSFFAAGNTTGSTTSESVSGSLTVSGAGLVSIGFSGGTLIVSATSGTTSQSAQTLGLFAVGNTTGATSSETLDARTVSFDGAGLVSVGFSAGSIVISATSGFTQTAPALSLFAVGNTTTSASSGVIQPGALSFDGAGLVSVGISGSSVVISASSAASATVENKFALGNTTAQSSSTTGTLTAWSVSGAGAISVGFSTTAAGAGVLVISGATVAAGNQSNVAVGNTTGTTSSATMANITFSGAGIVGVGFSASSLIISATTAASGTTENIFALGNTTAQTSSTTATLTNWSLSGAGGLSVGFSTTAAGAGVIVLSGATTIASATSGGLTAVGNTTGQSSSTSHGLTAETFSGAGGVSVGFSAGSIVISGATTVAQSAPSLSLFAVGNTTTSTTSGVIGAGSLSFDGAGIVSVGISGSSVVISATVAAPIASGTSENIFALGNTTAQTSSTTATLTNWSLSGAGGLSVGFSTTAAGAGVIVLSGATTVASQGGLSFNAIGNTTGVTSSSASSIPETLTLSGAGGVSLGFSSSTIVISGATTVASATNENVFALGNTTAATSSSVLTLTGHSLSGAGGVSIGFSTTGAGAGVIVISGATTAAPPASGTSENIFALGNTTAATSSTTATLTNWSVSGAGNVSVGFSTTGAGAGVLVISGATAAGATSENVFALGNTTAAASSSTLTLTNWSLSGAGGVSVGLSTTAAGSGVLVVSAPPVSSLSGVSGISLTSAGSTISIAMSDFNYLEPMPWLGSTSLTQPLGTMFVAPMSVQGFLSINQANFMSSRAVVAPIITASSSTASRTVTASGTWGSTASLVIYSQADNTNFSTFVSTTASFGMSMLVSASFSSLSKTISETVTFGWPQGTVAGSTSSMSTTFSTTSASVTTQFMNASSSNFSGWLRNDYPFAVTIPPGAYLAGIMWSTASGTSTLSTGLLTIAPPTWLATLGVVTYPALTIGVPGAALSSPFPGVGSTSSAASAVPGGISWESLSSSASYPRPYFYMMLGTG